MSRDDFEVGNISVSAQVINESKPSHLGNFYHSSWYCTPSGHLIGFQFVNHLSKFTFEVGSQKNLVSGPNWGPHGPKTLFPGRFLSIWGIFNTPAGTARHPGIA